MGGTWPPEVLEAVRDLRQGDLVRQPPIFYEASLNYPITALAREAASDPGGGSLLDVPEDERPAWGVITTQGCDLSEDDVKTPVRPWIQVSPVHSLETLDLDKGALGYLKENRIWRYFLMNPAELKGVWVADLRVEVSIEKGWLVNRQWVRGFQHAYEYRQFASHLARRVRRMAWDSHAFYAELGQHLLDYLRSHLTGGRQPSEIARLLLYVEGDEQLPDLVQLYVIGSRERAARALRPIFDAWYDEFVKVAAARNYALSPVQCEWRIEPDVYDKCFEIDTQPLRTQV